MMGVKPPWEGTAHSRAKEVPLSVFHCRADDSSTLVTPMNAAMFSQVHSVGFSPAAVSQGCAGLSFTRSSGIQLDCWHGSSNVGLTCVQVMPSAFTLSWFSSIPAEVLTFPDCCD